MPRTAYTALLACALAAGCAGSQPIAVENGRRKAPGKCSACHLAPTERSLPAERWEGFLTSHRRRARLSDEEKAFLRDFLVRDATPAAR